MFSSQLTHCVFRIGDEEIVTFCMAAANANEALVLAMSAEADEKADHRNFHVPGNRTELIVPCTPRAHGAG